MAGTPSPQILRPSRHDKRCVSFNPALGAKKIAEKMIVVSLLSRNEKKRLIKADEDWKDTIESSRTTGPRVSVLEK